MAILDFKDGRHVKSINAKISACKTHRRSILVSKCAFVGSRNAIKALRIPLGDNLFHYLIIYFFWQYIIFFSSVSAAAAFD